MSLFRISLGWFSCCLLALTILPSLVWAKQSFNYPSTGVTGFGNSNPVGVRAGTEFGVNSPSFPDTKVPGFADHSSMSPDSWSAPPTEAVLETQVVLPQTPVVLPPTQTVLQTAPSPITTEPDVVIVQTPVREIAPSGQDAQPPFVNLAPTKILDNNSAPEVSTISIPPVESVQASPEVQSAAQNFERSAEPNPFLANRPALLKYESQDALSNFKNAPPTGDDTPKVPNLQSDSPFKLAKTQLTKKQTPAFEIVSRPQVVPAQPQVVPTQPQVESNQAPTHVASLQSSYGNGSGTSQAVPAQPLPPQASPSQVLQPAGASYKDILAGQQSSNSNLIYGALPEQQFSSQPVISNQQFSSTPVVTQSTDGRYPLLQSSQAVPTIGSYQAVAQPYQYQPFQHQSQVQNLWGQQLPLQPVIQPHQLLQSGPNFRPDLGHRSPTPTIRHPGTFDTGEKFAFEDKKKEYPPLSEILKTGRYFGSAGVRFVRPHFQNNTGILTSSDSFVEGITLDHDFETTPHYRFGFESKFGPGIEFDYFRFNKTSNQAQFSSTGTVTGQIAQDPGRGLSPFGAFNAGETLSATHTLNFETFGVSFFKEVKLPISRINGRFGLQYVSIAQNLDATLADATGEIGLYNSRFDFRGFGPKFTLEYYRPIGHTKLEFVTTASGAVALGRRDEFVDNSIGQGFSRAGADELLTSVEFFSGVQIKKGFAENRSVFARFGTTYSTWLGGGTANDPQSDFGLRGFTLDVGYNR